MRACKRGNYSLRDGDGNGEVCLAEFQQWWAANGGDLEQHREKALTFVCEGGLEVLVVAPDESTKRAWVRGVEEVLREGKPRAVSFDVSAEAPSRESPQRPRLVRVCQWLRSVNWWLGLRPTFD